MSKKILISKKLTQNFPAPVAQMIAQAAASHSIKSFSLETVDESKTFYVGEGETFTGITAEGKSASFEVVSASNIGASGLSHKIGERFAMPAGSYLINVYYYTKYFMTVYQISPKMIGA